MRWFSRFLPPDEEEHQHTDGYYQNAAKPH
jgi:hypothetical protein